MRNLRGKKRLFKMKFICARVCVPASFSRPFVSFVLHFIESLQETLAAVNLIFSIYLLSLSAGLHLLYASFVILGNQEGDNRRKQPLGCRNFP